MTNYQLFDLLDSAKKAGLTYLFIDKTEENLILVSDVLTEYDVTIGIGENARIKISWPESWNKKE